MGCLFSFLLVFDEQWFLHCINCSLLQEQCPSSETIVEG